MITSAFDLYEQTIVGVFNMAGWYFYRGRSVQNVVDFAGVFSEGELSRALSGRTHQ